MRAVRVCACLAAVLLYACVLPLWARLKPGASREAVSYMEPRAPSPQEALLALARDPNVSEAQRRDAQERLNALYSWTEQEAAIEEELRAIGLEGSAVQIGAAYACVFVPAGADAERAAAILAAVEHISGLDAGHVRIIAR